MSSPTDFHIWNRDRMPRLGTDYVEFLHNLGGPSIIELEGLDSSRRRAIVTLLHGNEPSGLKAVWELMRRGVKPATDLSIVIASVHTALTAPLLSHRFMPDEEDFNRCFRTPVNTPQRQLAERLVGYLGGLQPEAVIDAHNTSAHSEPFAVTVSDTTPIRQLVTMFARHLVVFDQPMGTLIEQQIPGCHLVTVEFGGMMDPRADALALESLHDFMTRPTLFDAAPVAFNILNSPMRLEIVPGEDVHYSSTVQDSAAITFFNTIDQVNFQRLNPGHALGWLGETGMSALRLHDVDGVNRVREIFALHEGMLVTRAEMTVFMATTDPYIARRDCALYLTIHT